MKLYQQLVLFMLAATVLPLAGVGFFLLRGAERELTARIGNEQRALAEAAAESAAAEVMGAVDAIARSAELIDWRHTSAQELQGGLSLLYQQSPIVSAVLMVDALGEVRAGPVFLAEGGGGHPPFSPAGVGQLRGAIPLDGLKAGGKGQAALSAAYRHSLENVAALAVAVKLDAQPDAPFAVAELSLGSVSNALSRRTEGASGRIDLVDAAGKILASSEPQRALGNEDPQVWEAAQRELSGRDSSSFRVSSYEPILVAAAKVPHQLGMTTVVSVPERVALQPVRRMRRTVLAGIGGAMLVLLAAGLAFTRRLNRRLEAVNHGAEAFARGELAHRIPEQGADELTTLAETFNRMGSELEASRRKLMTWNDELKQRVDEATADLRAAQAQLLEAQKLAAVGQLGAGVAHEINNPLAGILGNAQLLMMDRDDKDPDIQMLKKIEQSAKRCKEITQSLLRFAQQRAASEFRPLDANALVREVLASAVASSSSDGVVAKAELSSEPLMIKGDLSLLTQAVSALVQNAKTALLKSEKKELTLVTRREGEEVILEVRDTGKGIKPEHLPRIFEPFFTTKDIWQNVGLGLSVAYRVANEHQAKLEVQTEVGKGSTFTLRFPTAENFKAPQQALPQPVGAKAADARMV